MATYTICGGYVCYSVAIGPPSPPVPPSPPAPVANFTGTPLTGTSPTNVTFTDSSTYTPTSWDWKRRLTGVGSYTTFSTVQNPSNISFTTGVWDIQLTATNAYGSNTKTRTGYITITASPPPPPGSPSLDFSVSTNSQYIGSVVL